MMYRAKFSNPSSLCGHMALPQYTLNPLWRSPRRRLKALRRPIHHILDDKRSIAGQIEYWAKIGQMIEENPDLPLPFIQDVLIGREQIKAGQGTPYIFGEGE